VQSVEIGRPPGGTPRYGNIVALGAGNADSDMLHGLKPRAVQICSAARTR
jgi:hypothetical protein